MGLTEQMRQAEREIAQGTRNHDTWPPVVERAYQELRAHPVQTLWSLTLTIMILGLWCGEN